MFTRVFYAAVASGLYSLAALSVQANGDGVLRIPNPVGDDTTVTELLLLLFDILLRFAVPVVVIFIIWAGFLYVTAQGNADQIKKATMALSYALIGGVLILSAYILVDIVQGIVDAIIG